MTDLDLSTEMLGFFGTDAQIRLQKLACSAQKRIMTTPGLFFSGRMIGIDDFEALGEAGVNALLAEQGMLNTRLIPVDRHAPWTARFEADNFRVDTALVFMGEAALVRERVEEIVSPPLPAGLRIARDFNPDDRDRFAEMQRFLVANGLAPVFGASLVEGPDATTVAIEDEGGSIRAVAHAYFPHNRFSSYHRCAWGGLVVVDPSTRGHGLGRIVNAFMLERAINRLGAERVYEIASRTNEPSRRMIESCGLVVRPDLMTSFIVPVDTGRFTR